MNYNTIFKLNEQLEHDQMYEQLEQQKERKKRTQSESTDL
jgi:hypothetical protein